jgi:hypothetical protein
MARVRRVHAKKQTSFVENKIKLTEKNPDLHAIDLKEKNPSHEQSCQVH